MFAPVSSKSGFPTGSGKWKSEHGLFLCQGLTTLVTTLDNLGILGTTLRQLWATLGQFQASSETVLRHLQGNFKKTLTQLENLKTTSRHLCDHMLTTDESSVVSISDDYWLSIALWPAYGHLFQFHKYFSLCSSSSHSPRVLATAAILQTAQNKTCPAVHCPSMKIKVVLQKNFFNACMFRLESVLS